MAISLLILGIFSCEEMERITVFFLMILSCSLCAGQSGTDLVDCSWLVTVDEADGDDCSLNEVQGNSTCSNLKDALSAVSTFPPDSCVEIIVNQGTYEVEGTVIIQRDLYLHGGSGQAAVIHLLVQPSEEFQYSLSFRNTNSVIVRDLQFVGSSGVIGFDNVSRVEVAHSSFR